MKISEIIRDAFDDMTTLQKLLCFGAVVAVLSVVLFGGFSLSSYQVRKLETEAAAEKENAKRWEAAANQREKEAFAFKEKNEYLEGQLKIVRETAKKQDEELRKQAHSVDRARAGVRDARSVRAIPDADADELCRKLGELGHPCG